MPDFADGPTRSETVYCATCKKGVEMYDDEWGESPSPNIGKVIISSICYGCKNVVRKEIWKEKIVSIN